MPRLSDKHIAAIRAAAEDNEQTYGFGDVILLCDELQDRRGTGPGAPTKALADQLLGRLGEGYDITEVQKQELLKYMGPQSQVPALELVSAAELLKATIKCVEEKEPLRDADVLALFHALQKQGYFQTSCVVNREALLTVVHALAIAEHPHIIRELQVTRNLPRVPGEPLNPIDQLIQDARNAPAQPD